MATSRRQQRAVDGRYVGYPTRVLVHLFRDARRRRMRPNASAFYALTATGGRPQRPEHCLRHCADARNSGQNCTRATGRLDDGRRDIVSSGSLFNDAKAPCRSRRTATCSFTTTPTTFSSFLRAGHPLQQLPGSGPGGLEVTAGGNILMAWRPVARAARSASTSLGAVVAGTAAGREHCLQAGVGSKGRIMWFRRGLSETCQPGHPEIAAGRQSGQDL